MLSQYHKDGNEKWVARGCKQKMEKYYEEFIYAAISDDPDSVFTKFTNVFPGKDYQESLGVMQTMVDDLGVLGSYSSVVDVDMYMFGLTYYVVFKKKKIDASKVSELKQSLELAISQFKNDASHQKSPNNLGHLRNRISKSIQIYGTFIAHESA